MLLPLNLRAALQFDVFLGMDDYVPEASWFPVICEVYNDGPSFNGVIEITGGVSQGGYPRLVPVELPTGTRKRVTIPVFCAASHNAEWHALLKDANGKTRAEQPNLRARGVVQRGTVLVGSLSRAMNWIPTFQKPQDNQRQWQPVAARFLTPLFPDNPIVLEGMDALYLSSERAADLRAQQVAAIETWINTGGHLILAVDQIGDVNTLPWLRKRVPMELSGLAQIQPGDALENWLRSPVKQSVMKKAPRSGGSNANRQKEIKVTMEAPFSDAVNDPAFDAAELAVATGRLLGGDVTVAVADKPLVVTDTHGLGRVTVLLFSPEREPFKSWKNQPTFWSRITEVPPRLYASADTYYPSGWGVDGIFGAMIDSRQVRKLPIPWLLLLLLVYLAIIGPVDQIWLRKIGKPMLTWITFPCYVALFSGLIYLVGYKLRAGESEWNELHVVDVFQSGADAEMRGRTFGSIYSPVNERYAFESSAKVAAFRGEYAGSWHSGSGNDRGKIVQSESAFRADVFVPVWTSQLYVNDWLQAAEAPFFAAVEKVQGGWKATVQNKLDKPLTHVRLVVDGRIFELEDVPARQTRQFSQSAAKKPKLLAEFVENHGRMFQSVVQQRRSAFGGMESGRLSDLPNCSAAASFLAHLRGADQYYTFIAPPTFDLSGAAEQDNAILLAWGDGQSPAKPLNQFSPASRTVNTLWRMTLPLNSTP